MIEGGDVLLRIGDPRRQARLGPPKQRAMLALLVCRPNTLVPASQLVDGLWGDSPPGSAGNLVQGYVSGLRKALGKEAIETQGAGYVLRVAVAALDLQRFEMHRVDRDQGLPVTTIKTAAVAAKVVSERWWDEHSGEYLDKRNVGGTWMCRPKAP